MFNLPHRLIGGLYWNF